MTKNKNFKIKSEQDGLELGVTIIECERPKGIVQLVHGMAEHKERYLPFMEYLAENGYNCIIHDHRGHGESVKSEKDLGYFYKKGGKSVVEDILTVNKAAKERWKGLPLYLFGHSMGSLAVRAYVKKYADTVNGLFVCGSPSKNNALGAAKAICGLNTFFLGGHHRSEFINGLAFGSYNKKFPNGTSEFRWLSENEDNVIAYEADPLCGYTFTLNGFRALFYLMGEAYSKKKRSEKAKGLPVHFIAGENDPCIVNRRKFKQAVKYMKKWGCEVTSKLYLNMRHEILNEKENTVVYADVLEKLNSFNTNPPKSSDKKYVVALDQGTTSSRAIVFDKNKNIVSVGQFEFPQHYPKSGYVEHNPIDIYNSQMAAFKKALEEGNISPFDIAAIGITNQRETTIIWDKKTGEPVYNAIVWQCRRTSEICEELKSKGLTKLIQQKTGLIIDAYFSGTKIKWILDNVKGARQRAEAGELLFGTVDTWLIWKMTGGKVHVTDYTNASRTMLFNINTLKWDDEILKILDIPRCILPKVASSGEVYGTYNIDGAEIPISGLAGDQQAALFGQGCFEKGDAKNTYGTGCFLLMNTGEKPLICDNGLLTTVGIGLNGHIRYALEGSVFVGGAVIQWLRDEMKFFENSSQSEEIAKSAKDNGGVYFVPAFTGLGAPYWDMYARGAIYGITRGTKREHIVRAALEAMAFQTDDLISAMTEGAGIDMRSLKVDGGASENDLLMQFQSDISGKSIIRPEIKESTALGAAMLAGLSTGFWTEEEILNGSGKCTRFTPSMTAEKREELKASWHDAVKRTLSNRQ